MSLLTNTIIRDLSRFGCFAAAEICEAMLRSELSLQEQVSYQRALSHFRGV